MRQGLILLLFVSQLGQAQSHWTSQEISGFFDTLVNQGPLPAITAVEANGVTAYDFGIDLIAQGRPEDALFWFSTLSLGENHPEKYLFGKAWTEMELGRFDVAMSTANQLSSLYKYPLVQARSHYMLAVIFNRVGSVDFSRSESDQAITIYSSINKQGGVILCQNLFFAESKNLTGHAPRDSSDE